MIGVEEGADACMVRSVRAVQYVREGSVEACIVPPVRAGSIEKEDGSDRVVSVLQLWRTVTVWLPILTQADVPASLSSPITRHKILGQAPRWFSVFSSTP